MTITTNPFYSKYGFNSPGFSVDSDGNITVKSITSEVPIVDNNAGGAEQTFEVRDSGGSFEIDGTAQNPKITLTKTKTYEFDIVLTGAFTWSIRTSQGNDYETGVTFVDANGNTLTGTSAHNNAEGTMTWVIPSNAPSGMYYSNVDGSVTGEIELLEPEITGEGNFTQLLVTGQTELRGLTTVNARMDISGILNADNTTQSTLPTNGALIVDGGVGIVKNLNVGGDFKSIGDITGDNIYGTTIQSNSIGAPDDGSSSSNLIVSATGYISLRIGNDSNTYTYTPTNADYNPATGVMVLTIGTHSLTTNHAIRLAAGSLVFTCAKDGNATTHAYPRASGVPNGLVGTDNYYNKPIPITAVTNTTITVNVGISNDKSAHTFVSASADAVTASQKEIKITSAGLQADIVNSTINGTTIGSTTPAQGVFTDVTINNAPTKDNSATRKDYVLATATALAVAFGL
jgi:hypothetical protein